MGYEIQRKFSYSEVSPDVAEMLHGASERLKEIKKRSKVREACECGEVLKPIQEKLASHRNGIFYAWAEAEGYTITEVQRDIKIYELISALCANKGKSKEDFFALPITLMIETVKKSAPQQLKDGVINGDITTMKQYRELKAQLEAEREAHKQTEARLQKSEEDRQLAEGNAKVFSKRAGDAEAEKQSLHLELLHKQNEIDALRHEQKMAEPQVIMQDSPDTIRAMSQLKIELEQAKAKAKDADIIRADNERLKRENAQYMAHEEGQTLREKAAVDAQFAKYKDTFTEELEHSMKLDKLFAAIIGIPKNIEMREMVNDYIKHYVGPEEEGLSNVMKGLIDLKAITEALDEALQVRGKLRIVK